MYYYYYFVIFYLLYCSIDCKYEYFCTTANRNFKRVFLKSILFELTNGISHVLVDRLTWNLEEIFTERTSIASTTDFKIWCFFLFLFTTQKTKSTRKIELSKCWHFFNFRNFAVPVVHAIAIFILMKMHSGFLVSNNQMDRNDVSHSNPFLKNMLCPRLYNFRNLH